jgi:hypothetical protein
MGAFLIAGGFGHGASPAPIMRRIISSEKLCRDPRLESFSCTDRDRDIAARPRDVAVDIRRVHS